MNEELEQAKVSLKNINDIADIKSNPVIEAVVMPVVKSIPVIGDMIDVSMNKVIEDFQKKKEQEFIAVILQDKNSITSEMVNDVEFIVNYAKTLEAVRRLATNDKVKYFGNLIRNGYLSGEHIDNSEFEEYLEIINSMSYREIHYLVGYKLFCDKRKTRTLKSLDERQGFLCEYLEEMDMEEQVSIIYMLPRLVRTGFVEEIYKTSGGWVNTENNQLRIENSEVSRKEYKLTSSYGRFFEMVLKMEE